MEIKSRPCPFTYIMQRYVRIPGPFYFRKQNRRVSTPERLHEHRIGHINKMTTYDCWISALLEVEATAPSKTDSANNQHTTTLVGQELRLLGLKCTLCRTTKSRQKLISASLSDMVHTDHGLWDRSHGTCSPVKCPRCQTHLGRTLEINLKVLPWPQRPDQVFAT